MISAKRINVGTDPVDLTEGSGTSGVSIQWLRNKGDTDLLLGGEGGIPLGPGESLPGMQLNSTDHLTVARAEGEGPVDVLLGWA